MENNVKIHTPTDDICRLGRAVEDACKADCVADVRTAIETFLKAPGTKDIFVSMLPLHRKDRRQIRELYMARCLLESFAMQHEEIRTDVAALDERVEVYKDWLNSTVNDVYQKCWPKGYVKPQEDSWWNWIKLEERDEGGDDGSSKE